MKTIKKLLFLLLPRERKQVILLLFMMIIMAILEMIGVVSIMPFVAVLVNTDIIQTNFFLQTAFELSNKFGVETEQEFLFLLGVLVFLLLVFSIAFKFLTIYAQLRFTAGRNYTLAKRFMEGYLRQPYSWFLNRHSAELGTTILNEVNVVITQGFHPMLDLIRQIAVTLAIIVVLILVNPKLTLIVGLTIGIAYGLIFIFIRSYTAIIGKKRMDAVKWMFTSISEAFGASKEIKVGGLEDAFIERFSSPAKSLSVIKAKAGVIVYLPRFILEVIAFGGMLLVILYLLSQSGNFTSAIPLIALYAFAGYRLMPAVQQIYTSLTTLSFIGPALDSIHKDLKGLQTSNINLSQDNSLQFEKEITLKNIYYNYPNTSRTALKNINLSIPAYTTVGIVGSTGSGKTTTVDIILGLLEAQQGSLQVDGKKINKDNVRAWQRSIGYVPQNIFLTDDTVTANIAFGIDQTKIDHKAVENAAKIAKLHEFVINELPQKYETSIGERGVRLSGGQRQRIGIARALYNNPKVLILDEATSSLDNLTEQEVMEKVKDLGKDMTIIMIAHRINTVKDCDNIFLIQKGELKQKGTFQELDEHSDYFSLDKKKTENN